jgi:hypothetical protein
MRFERRPFITGLAGDQQPHKLPFEIVTVHGVETGRTAKQTTIAKKHEKKASLQPVNTSAMLGPIIFQ